MKILNIIYRSFNFSKFPKDSGRTLIEFAWKFVYKKRKEKQIRTKCDKMNECVFIYNEDNELRFPNDSGRAVSEHLVKSKEVIELR